MIEWAIGAGAVVFIAVALVIERRIYTRRVTRELGMATRELERVRDALYDSIQEASDLSQPPLDDDQSVAVLRGLHRDTDDS